MVYKFSQSPSQITTAGGLKDTTTTSAISSSPAAKDGGDVKRSDPKVGYKRIIV